MNTKKQVSPHYLTGQIRDCLWKLKGMSNPSLASNIFSSFIKQKLTKNCTGAHVVSIKYLI